MSRHDDDDDGDRDDRDPPRKLSKKQKVGMVLLKGLNFFFKLQDAGVIKIKELDRGGKIRKGIAIAEGETGIDVDGDGDTRVEAGASTGPSFGGGLTSDPRFPREK